ncbi:Ig-like domain-containing protein [Roseateles sp.]|uniref:Ig-like domain-containing protein n=1 Tax=Roseateles sp. TaxID=1971397 RepID=UPI0031D52880
MQLPTTPAHRASRVHAPADAGAPPSEVSARPRRLAEEEEEQGESSAESAPAQEPQQTETVPAAQDPAASGAPPDSPTENGEAVQGSNGKDEKSTEKSVAAMVTWLLGAALSAGSAVALSGGSGNGGADAKPEGEPSPQPDPGPKPDPNPNPNPQPDPKPDPNPNPDPGPKPDPNPNPNPNPDPGPKPDPDPNPNPDPGPKPDPNPNPDPGPKPDPHPNPDPAVRVPPAPQPALHSPGAQREGLLGSAGEIRIGKLEADGRWEYSLDEGKTWHAGSGSVIAPSALGTDGSKSLQVVQISADGHRSPVASLRFDMDTIAPPGAGLTLISDTGSSATDGWTNDGRIRIDGLEPDARWQYSVDGGATWWNGTDSTLSTAQLGADGAKDIRVRQVDPAGNEGPVTTLSLLLDTRAAELTLALAMDTGLSASDGITRDATVKVNGLESGLRWEYRIDDGPWVTGTGDTIAASEFGTTAGERRVEVRHVDGAGNRGTAALDFVLDTHTVSPGVQLAVDSGVSGDKRTNDPTVLVSGLESLAIWDYQINGGEWRRGHGDRIDKAAFDGVADGYQLVRVRQIDAAGNEAGSTLAFDLRRQASAPAVSLLNDTGTADDRITRDGTLRVRDIEWGGSWDYRINGAEWKTGSGVLIDGREFDRATDGWQRVEVRHLDAVGNQATTVYEFQLDRIAPPPSLALANDTGVADDRLTRDGTVIVGGLEPDCRWEYRIDGGAWRAGVDSRIAASEFGADGAHKIEVRQIDIAGNASTATLDFTLDRHVGPIEAALVNDSGVVGDRITNDATIAVTGVEAGNRWEYRIGGGAWKTGSGDRIAASEFGVDGRYTVEVRQTDPAGNESSSTFDFTLDRQAGALSVALANDSGMAGDRITNDAAIAVGGLDASRTWEYRVSGGAWKAGSGDRIPATEFAKNGPYTVEVRQANSAGNMGTATLDFTLDRQVDPIAVALLNDSGVATDRITNDATIAVTGVELGNRWEYRIGGGAWKTGSGDRVAASEFGADGTKSLEVRQIDVAGNVSTATLDFTLDRQVGQIGAALARDSGVAGDGITSLATIAVTGIETGNEWRYRIDGGSWKTGSGNVIAASEFVKDDRYTVEVMQTDVAGNVSSATLTFTLDRSVAAPTLSLAQDTGISASDRITSVAEVSVGGLEDGAQLWEYSRDGLTWTAGTGTSIAASEFSGDGDKRVLVRQVDLAGNVSAATELKFTLDTKADAPTLTFNSAARTYWANRPGNFLEVEQFYLASKALNANGSIDVGLESGSLWLYSLNGGQDWWSGAGSNFKPPAQLSPGRHELQVRQVDIAGNESGIRRLEFDYDTTAPTVVADRGKDGSLTVTSQEDVELVFVSYGKNLVNLQDWQPEAVTSGQRLMFAAGSKSVLSNLHGALRLYAIDSAGNAMEVPVKMSSEPASLQPALVMRLDESSGGKWALNHEERGTAGNDVLNASPDSDFFTGGAGADTFRWSKGQTGVDLVLDYKRSEGDVLDLSALTAGYTEATRDDFFFKEVLKDGTIALTVTSEGGRGIHGLSILVTALDGDALLSVKTASGMAVI